MRLLLVEPGAARLYRDSLATAPVVRDTAPTQPELGGSQPAAQSASRPGVNPVVYGASTAPAPAAGGSPKMKSFHGAVEVNAATAKARLMQIAEEVICQRADKRPTGEGDGESGSERGVLEWGG